MKIVKRDLMDGWGKEAWTVHDNVTTETWMITTEKLFHPLRIRLENLKEGILLEEK